MIKNHTWLHDYVSALVGRCHGYKNHILALCGKLRLIFFYNKILMINCKMTHAIQGILPSHYLHNVNLGNYGLPHVPKSVTPQCVFIFNNDLPKGLLTFSMFVSFSTFTPPLPMVKSSWEWYKPLLFKFGFLDLDLVIVHLHWIFFFYNHGSSNSPINTMSISFCYPTFDKPSHQLVGYMPSSIDLPIQGFNFFLCIWKNWVGGLESLDMAKHASNVCCSHMFIS